jgi:signal peptidase I
VTLATLAFIVYGTVVLGFRASPVMSDSMSPLVKQGDMVLYVNTNAITPKQNDVIIFTANLDATTTIPVVHRWVKTSPQGNIVTKGDNNERADPWVTKETDINGVMVGYLPLHVLRNPWTIPVAGTVLGFVIISYMLMAFTGRKPEKENTVADAYTSPRRIVKHQPESARTTALKADKKTKPRKPTPTPLDWYSGGENIPNSPPRYPWLEPVVKIVKPTTINETNTFAPFIKKAAHPIPVIPEGWTPRNITLPPEPEDIYYITPKNLPERPKRNT